MGGWLLSALDGEFLLRWLPNGGGVVVARAAWLTVVVLIAYIALKERLQPGASWEFCGACFQVQPLNNLTLGAAIFAGAYAALCARFASQWTCLAGLYNEIMLTQSRWVAETRIRKRHLRVESGLQASWGLLASLALFDSLASELRR